MDKEKLKLILKPLIKECIKEVMFEDGTLSSVISEVVKGLRVPLHESHKPSAARMKTSYLETDEEARRRREKLIAGQRKMMKAVGEKTYNGVNLFEGTTPAPDPHSQSHGALKDVLPSDPGVDISSFGKSSLIWQRLKDK